MSPQARYQDAIDTGALEPDAEQQHVIAMLQQIHQQLLNTPLPEQQTQGWFGRLFQKLSPTASEHAGVKGLYLWGGVGRGKTILTDLFYESVPFRKKIVFIFITS